MKAIGYTRLSQSSDPSIERQKKHIREMSEEYGYDLHEIIDDGQRTTGFDDNREGFKRLYKLIRDDEVDVVLLNDKRRLARDYDLTTDIIDYLRTNEILMHTYREGEVRITSPTEAAFEVFKAANEHEAMQRYIEATREAVQERLDNGYDHGTPPFGLEFGDESKYWVPCDDEWPRLKTAFEMRFDEDGNIDKGLATIANEIGISVASVHRLFDEERVETYETAAGRVDCYEFEWGDDA